MPNLSYKNTVHFLAFAFIGVFIISLYQRWINGDDAWFAEQAYWFVKNGYVRSDLFAGNLDYEIRQYVYHKLHIWQGALAIYLFEFDAYLLKAINLVYIILFLFFIQYYLKSKQLYSHLTFSIFILFFFSNDLIIQHGFTYRPEISMMFFGFISFMLLDKSITSDNLKLSIFAGLATGITALFHLNGFVYIAAGVSLLLIHKKYKFSVLFMFAAFVSFFPYFFELINPENLKMYTVQFKNDPALSKDEFTILGWLKKLILEPKRYMHHSYEFLYLVIIIASLLIHRKRIKTNAILQNILVYFLLTTVFTGIITPGSKTIYLLFSLPFAMLLISVLMSESIESKKVKLWFSALTVLYLATNLGHFFSIYENRNSNIVALHKNIVDKYSIEKNSKILAPRLFIFDQIENFTIQGFLGYQFQKCYAANNCHIDKILFSADTLFTDNGKAGKSFIILTNKNLEDLNFIPELNQTYSGYRYVGVEEHYHIFKKQG